MDPAGLRPLGIGEILDVGIKIYRARFRVLVTSVAVVLGPVFVLSALIRISFPVSDELLEETQPGATPEIDLDRLWPFIAGIVLIVILASLAAQVATGACFKAVSGAYLDEEPGWRESLRFARSKLGSLLWLSLLTTVCVILGMVLCIVPGIYLWLVWSVAAPALLLEDVRGWKAMNRSRELVKGRFWPTVAVVLLVTLITAMVQAVIVSILVMLVSVSGNDVALAIADAIGQTASSALTTPLSAAVLTVLYFDLRVRKEGFDLELLSRRMGVDPATVANPAFFPPPRPDDRAPGWPPPPPSPSFGPEDRPPGGPPSSDAGPSDG